MYIKNVREKLIEMKKNDELNELAYEMRDIEGNDKKKPAHFLYTIEKITNNENARIPLSFLNDLLIALDKVTYGGAKEALLKGETDHKPAWVNKLFLNLQSEDENIKSQEWLEKDKVSKQVSELVISFIQFVEDARNEKEFKQNLDTLNKFLQIKKSKGK